MCIRDGTLFNSLHTGIWDCLSSQQVVDIVRRQIAEGKELSEICEMICDHCLAPDTLSGAGIGCDNMTILIVAILNGRTKEEWSAWVTQRVNDNNGYPTPSSLPTLYSASRLMSFRARREAQERRHQEDRQSTPFGRAPAMNVGVSFVGSGISNDNSTLMFGSSDEEEDSGDEENHEDDETNAGSSFFSQPIGIGHSDSLDATNHIKAQLVEYEKDIRQEDDDGETWLDATDEDSHPSNDSGVSSQHDLQGEAPPPSKSLPNGDASSVSQEQLRSHNDQPKSELAGQGSIDSADR